MAAVLNFQLPVTSCGIQNSAIEFLDPENWGLAVGMALRSCLEAEISISGLAAAILNFRLPFTSGGIPNSAIEFLDPENWGLPVGTASLTSLEAEI